MNYFKKSFHLFIKGFLQVFSMIRICPGGVFKAFSNSHKASSLKPQRRKELQNICNYPSFILIFSHVVKLNYINTFYIFLVELITLNELVYLKLSTAQHRIVSYLVSKIIIISSVNPFAAKYI